MDFHIGPRDAGYWQAAASSVRGVRHEQSATPCQDACAQLILPHSSLVIAVADGAGSSRWSQYGSSAAVERVITYFHNAGESFLPPETDEEWQLLLQTLLRHALLAVKRKAVELKVTPHDLSTTLLIALVTPTVLAVAQIGDGAVVAAEETGVPFSLTTPQSGEYVNDTVFLTSAGALDGAQCNVFHGSVRHVAVFTDGLQMLALTMPAGTAYAPFFSSLFHYAEKMRDEETFRLELQRFLTSKSIRSRTDDDVTLALAAYIT